VHYLALAVSVMEEEIVIAGHFSHRPRSGENENIALIAEIIGCAVNRRKAKIILFGAIFTAIDPPK